MELFLEPSTYIALGMLVILEVVLGIDNLVFIAILADKLPPSQRSRARVIGLSLALLIRCLLLFVMSWLVGLTKPLFILFEHTFSWRDLILLSGGLFLLYKATTELHERLDSFGHHLSHVREYASFWVVVAQILVLDAVFSIDAVITAVGMVKDLPVMIVAVTIAMGLMLLASKPLTRFVSKHPTVVVLCLSFLLLIGLSLIAEGMGFGIPKGYLYAAIGFSILIEFFNQLGQRNLSKNDINKSLRLRTAQTVMRILGSQDGQGGAAIQDEVSEESEVAIEHPFTSDEIDMVSRVLVLSERTVRSMMTHRSEADFIDLDNSPEQQKEQIYAGTPSILPVCHGSLDNVVGTAYAVDLLASLVQHGSIQDADIEEAVIVPESMRASALLEMLKKRSAQFALVADEYGTIEGIVTVMDIFEAIVGQLPDSDEVPPLQKLPDGSLIIAGTADVHLLEATLGISDLVSEEHEYSSLAGFMLFRLGRMPLNGDFVEHGGYRFIIEEMAERRITSVRLEKLAGPSTEK